MQGLKHLYVPDTQVKPGVPLNHFHWLAYFALDKQPDVVVWAGDHWDMPSLSSYDKKGSRAMEGRRIRKDVDAGHKAMEIVQGIWRKRGFKPHQEFTTGNHENRWKLALEDNPQMLEGMFPDDDPFQLDQYDILQRKFLVPTEISGILYSHFFPHDAKGRITQTKRGAPNATAQVQRQMMSATAGHQQGLDVSILNTATRGMQRGLIAGSFYLHDEDFMPQNNYWRGLILKHGVHKGNYNLCEVDIRWLQEKYRLKSPLGTVKA